LQRFARRVGHPADVFKYSAQSGPTEYSQHHLDADIGLSDNTYRR
jgi:hypothetical protein